MDEEVRWELPLGSAETQEFEYEGLNLTGYTLEIFRMVTNLTGHLTVAPSNLAQGRFTVSIDSVLDLEPDRSYTFAVLLVPPGGDRDKSLATPLIRVIPR